jgi:hypothetical protein
MTTTTTVDALATRVGVEIKAVRSEKVSQNGTITSIVKVTQAAYDLLTPSSTTLYVIVG